MTTPNTTPTAANNNADNNNADNNTTGALPFAVGVALAKDGGALHRRARWEEVEVGEGYVLSYHTGAPDPDRGESGGFGWSLRSPEGERIWEKFWERGGVVVEFDTAVMEAANSLWGYLTSTLPGQVPVWVEAHESGALRFLACEEGSAFKPLWKGLGRLGGEITPEGLILRGLAFTFPKEGYKAPHWKGTMYLRPDGEPRPPETGWERLGGASLSVGGGYVGEVITLEVTDNTARGLHERGREIPEAPVVTLGGVEATFFRDNVFLRRKT